MAESVKLVQDESNPVLPEVLAASLKSIGDAVRAWDRAGLKRRALVVLIHDKSRVPMRDIEIVLNNLVDMQRDWMVPKPQQPTGKKR